MQIGEKKSQKNNKRSHIKSANPYIVMVCMDTAQQNGRLKGPTLHNYHIRNYTSFVSFCQLQLYVSINIAIAYRQGRK